MSIVTPERTGRTGLRRHHRVAVVAAAATSAIALNDAITHGLTGSYSAVADDSGNTLMIVLGSVVHGVTYAALAWVLHREAARFAEANKAARPFRWVLLVTLPFFAFGFVVAQPMLTLTGTTSGALATVWGGVATGMFIAMLAGALGLGLALVRNRSLGYGARILSAMLPVAALTVLVGWLAPDWAHPAYAETVLHFGLALLGVGAPLAAVTTHARPRMAA